MQLYNTNKYTIFFSRKYYRNNINQWFNDLNLSRDFKFSMFYINYYK